MNRNVILNNSANNLTKTLVNGCHFAVTRDERNQILNKLTQLIQNSSYETLKNIILRAFVGYSEDDAEFTKPEELIKIDFLACHLASEIYPIIINRIKEKDKIVSQIFDCYLLLFEHHSPCVQEKALQGFEKCLTSLFSLTQNILDCSENYEMNSKTYVMQKYVQAIDDYLKRELNPDLITSENYFEYAGQVDMLTVLYSNIDCVVYKKKIIEKICSIITVNHQLVQNKVIKFILRCWDRLEEADLYSLVFSLLTKLWPTYELIMTDTVKNKFDSFDSDNEDFENFVDCDCLSIFEDSDYYACRSELISILFKIVKKFKTIQINEFLLSYLSIIHTYMYSNVKLRYLDEMEQSDLDFILQNEEYLYPVYRLAFDTDIYIAKKALNVLSTKLIEKIKMNQNSKIKTELSIAGYKKYGTKVRTDQDHLNF